MSPGADTSHPANVANTPVARPELAAYLEKVRTHAYKVTDADVEQLKAAGLSEDEIFEQTVAAAISEGLRDFDQYRMIVYALVLIGMMLLRPQGLFGIHEIWDFWPRRKNREHRSASGQSEGSASHG